MKQALEALENSHAYLPVKTGVERGVDQAITALSQAIEQAEDAVAAEREACAKLCDDKVDAEYATGKVDHNEIGWTQSCAAAIRARGNT
jgi:hypothetical protein